MSIMKPGVMNEMEEFTVEIWVKSFNIDKSVSKSIDYMALPRKGIDNIDYYQRYMEMMDAGYRFKVDWFEDTPSIMNLRIENENGVICDATRIKKLDYYVKYKLKNFLQKQMWEPDLTRSRNNL